MHAGWIACIIIGAGSAPDTPDVEQTGQRFCGIAVVTKRIAGTAVATKRVEGIAVLDSCEGE